MARNDVTSKIIDEVLRISATSGAIAAGIVLPNLLIALEKPLQKFLGTLDARDRQREAARVVRYMKAQGLLKGDYEHGLQISPKGSKRLQELDFDRLIVNMPEQWDHAWRIVFYDIPETHSSGRRALTAKVRELGFFQLQKSVWIHPFPCREVVEKVTHTFEVAKFVSYIETHRLDNQDVLVARFQKRYPVVQFS